MEILLGDGTFRIGTTTVGLTKGGGVFTVEREFKDIEADGDYGPVKDRVRIVKQVAKLSFKRLQKILTEFATQYPAITTSTTTGTFNAMTYSGTGTLIAGTQSIPTGDYKATVEFVGRTIEGKFVVIQLQNAMCRENIEWSLADKDEVVPELTYTAHYAEGSTTPPWNVLFVQPTTA